MIRARFRIRFSKTGPLRWISHRDLIRLWERLIRRAELKLSMTEGFHPKPRMNFPSALALGTESLDEVVELELAEEMTAEELASRLRDDGQPGLGILDVIRVPDGSRKAQLFSTTYNLPIPEGERDAVASQIETFRNSDTLEIVRKDKTLKFKTASAVPNIAMEDGQLVFELAAGRQATLRPTDLIETLGITHVMDDGQYLTRTKVRLEDENDSTNSTPIEEPTAGQETVVN